MSVEIICGDFASLSFVIWHAPEHQFVLRSQFGALMKRTTSNATQRYIPENPGISRNFDFGSQQPRYICNLAVGKRAGSTFGGKRTAKNGEGPLV